MDGAGLAHEAAAEKLKDAIDLEEGTPKAMGGVGIVGSVGLVLREADRVRDLVRHLVDFHNDAHAVQEIHSRTIEVGNGLWLERERSFFAMTGAGDEAVTDKVEFDLNDFVANR